MTEQKLEPSAQTRSAGRKAAAPPPPANSIPFQVPGIDQTTGPRTASAEKRGCTLKYLAMPEALTRRSYVSSGNRC
jgi:hypothetical protein